MRKQRLLWQLFLANVWITVPVMIAVGAYATRRANELYQLQTTQKLESAIAAVQARLAEISHLDGGTLLDHDSLLPLRDRLGEICRQSRDLFGVRITIIATTGQVVADSDEDAGVMDNHRERPEVAAALAGNHGSSTRMSATLREELMYLALPVVRDGLVVAVVRSSLPSSTLKRALAASYREIVAAGLLTVILVAVTSYFISRRIVLPLEEVRMGAERFSRGDLKHRLPDSNSEEFGMLSDSLNRMAEDLDERIHTILRQQNEHQAMLSSMEEGVMAVDRSGTILSVNDTCANLLGVPSDKLRGRGIYEALRKPDLLKFVENALSSSVSLDGDLRFYGPEERWLNAHGTALHDARGQKIGVLIVLHDVTRLRRLENVRRDFVANVSHELRTPITSIKGFVETLIDEKLESPEHALRFLNIVLRQVNRLDAIINDLLLLSRIERGAEDQTIETGRESFADILQAAVETCERKATAKGVRISVTVPLDLVASVNGPLLEQAVINLIDNAIKYSGSGGTVRVEARREEANVVVQVVDNGCGIGANHLPRLFERFYRVDSARSRVLGGTGLGLAIVKHIVTTHQGTVNVESVVGKGSTFTIRLPIEPPMVDGSQDVSSEAPGEAEGEALEVTSAVV